MSFFAGLVQGIGGGLSQQQAEENARKERSKNFLLNMILHKSEDPNITYDEQRDLLNHLGEYDKRYKGVGDQLFGGMVDQPTDQGAPIQTNGLDRLRQGTSGAADADMGLIPPPIDAPTYTPRRVRTGSLSPAQIAANRRELEDRSAHQDKLDEIAAQGRAYMQRSDATTANDIKKAMATKGQWFINQQTGQMEFHTQGEGDLSSELTTPAMKIADERIKATETVKLKQRAAILAKLPANAGKTPDELMQMAAIDLNSSIQTQQKYLEGKIKVNDMMAEYMGPNFQLRKTMVDAMLERQPYVIDNLKAQATKATDPVAQQMMTDAEQFWTARGKMLDAAKRANDLNAKATAEDEKGNVENAKAMRQQAANEMEYAEGVGVDLNTRADALKTKYGDRISIEEEGGVPGISIPGIVTAGGAQPKGAKRKNVRIKSASGGLTPPPTSTGPSYNPAEQEYYNKIVGLGGTAAEAKEAVRIKFQK